MIAAAFHSANYSDPSAESYLIETLIKRRNALLRAYLPKITPLIHLSLDASGTFRTPDLPRVDSVHR
jgi:hypothetical protein